MTKRLCEYSPMPTKAKITMDEIPFAPITQLCDTVPPTELPPAPAPYKRPSACRLIAWRHDNALRDIKFDTLESAQVAARNLHWAVYWKYAIQSGRDMVERALIDAPAG